MQIHTKSILAGILLIFLAACLPVPYEKNAPTDLPSLIDAVTDLDRQYETDWRLERITGTMINPKAAPHMRADLEDLRISVENNSLLTRFIDARIAMIDSQAHYHRALELDPSGLKEIEYTTINGTLALNVSALTRPNCNNASLMLNAASELQQALSQGHTFINTMDSVLQESDEAKQLIGVNEARPRFYESPLGKVKLTADINRALVGMFCTEA